MTEHNATETFGAAGVAGVAVTLEQLQQLVGGDIHGDAGASVDSISLDSKALADGGLFAALPGTRSHGARFASTTPAAAALTDAAGAEILLADAAWARPLLVVDDVRAVLGTVAAEIYAHPTKDLTVIGITGTSGKTTTSYLVEAGLLAAGKSVGLIGTTGTRINRQKVPTSLTTPEAPKLQELFAQMRNVGVTHVVMEVSSHALSLGRVQGTRFAAGGFSNLSQDHLDFHPTMEEYFDAKAGLFVGPDAAREAVICVDDEWGQKMRAHASASHAPDTLWTVSTKGAAATAAAEATKAHESGEANAPRISARTLSVEPSGAQEIEMRILARALGETEWVKTWRLPLPGDFNVANAALATGLALAAGLDAADLEAFVQGMSEVAVPGRMQRIDEGQDFIAVVDYAHKPAAVAAVLDTLREQLGNTGRIGVVVGAGGDRDSSKRPIMGAAAAQRADLVIVTDDNPRTEDPALIRAAVLQGAHEAAAEVAERSGKSVDVREIGSRADAIDALVEWAQPGDAIIVVGKGHEVGQIVGDVTHHFDDREEMQRALAASQAGEKLGQSAP